MSTLKTPSVHIIQRKIDNDTGSSWVSPLLDTKELREYIRIPCSDKHRGNQLQGFQGYQWSRSRLVLNRNSAQLLVT